MQVSIKWLHDYIDFKETAEELADKLTMAGVPVENVIRADAGLERSLRAVSKNSHRIRIPIICRSAR